MKKNNVKYFFIIAIIIYLVFRIKNLRLRINKLKSNRKLKKYISISEKSKDEMEVSASFYTIGNIYLFELKDYNTAIEYFQKVIESGQKNYLEDSAMFNLGLCYKKIGKKEKARHFFLRVIEMFPKTARAKDAELEISRL
ncbi:MAG: tetratricopeptide repeat protein [Candidatus Muirbacterium halophilum]|nr:tetratricopeptide repeat protein [Candidatus Muirbacterium halophilum]